MNTPTLLEVPKRREQILILDENCDDLQRGVASVRAQFPDARVVESVSIRDCGDKAEAEDFDIVVCSYDLAQPNALELIHRLKLKDNEPGILVVAKTCEPSMVTQVYQSGAHKFVLKTDSWVNDLPPNIRQLIRMRRLEEENRKLLAKLTEANILLEEKNKRLDEFSVTVAHDIRGPLAGISMKLEYLLDSYGAGIEPRFKELMSRALDSAGRLTGIVQTMYEFARLGAQASKMAEVELGKLATEVASDLNVEARLDVKIGIGDLPIVWGNADLLRRVIINLITNAIKYNDKKEIIINVGLESIVEKCLAPYCTFYVEDNGPGIPEEELRTSFAMFVRGSAGKKDDEGMGIGLSVVQRIIDLHFGQIRVESGAEKGTKFLISLPMERVSI